MKESPIIKGVILSTWESWIVGDDKYASLLLTVAYSWIEKHFDRKNLLKENLDKTRAREFGKIKATILAYTSDLHNVSINFCLLHDILTDSEISIAKKHLYSGLVLENYFTNLRSLLDFIPNIIKLSLTEKQLKVFPDTDSLNKLIKFTKNTRNTNKLPIVIHDFLTGIEEVLDEVKTIRDLIIHKGKEILISQNDSKRLYIRIPKTGMYSNDNMLPNILDTDNIQYELYTYLNVITKKVFKQTEDIGTIMLNDVIENNKFDWFLFAIGNHCFVEFNNFMINSKQDLE